jgi:NADPH2:quinone reductase
MEAAWYEKQGPADEVLIVGEMPDPQPEPGEVRIRVAASGINPGDVKKRQDTFGVGMPYPRVIPHSDGAGTIDSVGEGVPASRVGERVWCFGAQSSRPFGTAAEYVVIPAAQAVPLSTGVSFEQGACLGIPGITGHRAVHVAGPVAGKTVLVQGGVGAVGQCAVQLAHRAGARVLATVRNATDAEVVRRAGANEVLVTGPDLVEEIRAYAPAGIDHVVEVAFGHNVTSDVAVLADGGSIATYATSHPEPPVPFWPLVFKNVRLFFLGSDDFPSAAKAAAAQALNAAFAAGWAGFEIAHQFPLSDIALAHERVEHPTTPGRVVLELR